MTLPDAPRGTVPAPESDVLKSATRLPRVAIWVALGGLVAATIAGVIMVLIGDAGDLAARALLTVLLIAAFSGAVFLESALAARRPAWFVLTSMSVWVATLLIGAVMIWLPTAPLAPTFGDAGLRTVSFLLIVLILQLAVLYIRLFVKGWRRQAVPLIDVIARVTIVLVCLLVVMLVFPLMLRGWVIFHDIYWRLLVAVAILAAVGTALVPLVKALLAPHSRAAYPVAAPPATPAWPTYPDGYTPLPVAPDGQPDWNAYQAYIAAAAATQPAAVWPVPQPAWTAQDPWAAAAAPAPQDPTLTAPQPGAAGRPAPAVSENPYSWAPPSPVPPVATQAPAATEAVPTPAPGQAAGPVPAVDAVPVAADEPTHDGAVPVAAPGGGMAPPDAAGSGVGAGTDARVNPADRVC